MRKYFSELFLFLLGIPLFIILSGCEKDFDEVVDVTTGNYQVASVVGIEDKDLKNPADSLLSLRIIFSEGSNINKVYFNIQASDKTILNSSPIEMLPISETIFENNYVLKRANPIGNYTVNFFVTDFDGEEKKVAAGYFYFNNGQDNVAPAISNAILPETVGRDVSFTFSVTASDPNGLNDVAFVFFSLYRPDSTVVEETPGDIFFSMHDDGNLEIFGDVTAGDGIYSFKNLFSETALIGTWRFVFRAIDRSGLFSNIIEKTIIVE